MEDLLRASDILMKISVVACTDQKYTVLERYDRPRCPIISIKPSRLLNQYCGSNDPEPNEEGKDDKNVDISIFHTYVVIQ